MGISAGLGQLLAGLAGAASNIFGDVNTPEGQFLSSFEYTPERTIENPFGRTKTIPAQGSPETDPTRALTEAFQRVSRLSDFAEQNLARGVEAPSAYAQTLPTFTGGGLPFPIGMTGRDPALDNPNLRYLRGLGITERGIAGAGRTNYIGGPDSPTSAPVDRFTPRGSTLVLPAWADVQPGALAYVERPGTSPAPVAPPSEEAPQRFTPRGVARRPVGTDLITGQPGQAQPSQAASAAWLLRQALIGDV